MLSSFCALLLSLSPVNAFEIQIDGLQEGTGLMRIAFYDSEEIYLDQQQVTLFHEEQVRAQGSMHIHLQIPTGTYAIAVYHDVNSDKELNKNFLGLPKEPYGFSNNKMGTFGPPSFQESLIAIPQTKKIVIDLR